MTRRADLLVWLVPVCAAAALAYYAVEYREENGPLVTVGFADASGIRSDATPALHRGVAIGKVVGVDLSADKARTLVRIRLRRDQSEFAEEGASFWVTRPEVTESGVGGLNALFSGPYVEARPGKGARVREFAGLERPPLPPEAGVEVVLRAPQLLDLRPGAPVYYRGVEVGDVRDVRLSADARSVEARVVVRSRYRALVRANSRFWTTNGLDVKGGLFSGVELKTRSLVGLVSGGISFATPDRDMGAPARDGDRFALEERPQAKWLLWTPRIPIEPSGETPDARRPAPLPTGADLMELKSRAN